MEPSYRSNECQVIVLTNIGVLHMQVDAQDKVNVGVRKVMVNPPPCGLMFHMEGEPL